MATQDNGPGLGKRVFKWTRAQLRFAKWAVMELARMRADYGFAYTSRKIGQVLWRDGLMAIRHRRKMLAEAEKTWADTYLLPDESTDIHPKVSVIVPNYNHAPYLRQRLDSVYGQTYTNYEVILLDDCSTDDSRDILREYAARYPDNTSIVLNEQNSGGPFQQWQKGLGLASGELIWIAESDDYCEPDFLATLVKYFVNEAVVMAFCRSDFVSSDASRKVWSIEDFLADTPLGGLDKPWVRSAHWLVNHGWAMKNVIPNVSSAIFRHPGDLPLLHDAAWKSMRLCGDWVFYLNLIRGGLVAYTPETVNYYRQHESGTSVNTQKRDIYYQEHEIVARKVLELYRIDTDILDNQRKSLYRHWCGQRGSRSEAEFQALYDLSRARASAAPRKPNLLMAGFAMAAGGGETFPITLANCMREAGYAVTFLNFQRAPTEPGIRTMLSPNVPLLVLGGIDKIAFACRDMGIDVVHSHHAWVDITLASRLHHDGYTKHVVTMHGMYEMMEKWEFERLLPILKNQIDSLVYTAQKNLRPFSPGFQAEKGLIHIPNALEAKPLNPVDRASLGIGPEDFVLCLVARAIPEKGWEEAIDAVSLAQKQTSRKLHLVLIGEGIESERLQHRAGDTVHFVGFRSNIRDYFAMSDMSILPSRFRGESYPLVLIDSLLAGRPVLASNIGEIASMLDAEGEIAGVLFELEDWRIPVPELAAIIHRVATDSFFYGSLLQAVEVAARKFDQSIMVQRYNDVYTKTANIGVAA